MDRFLFEEFVVPLDDEVLDGFYKMILSKAQKKVEFKEKGYYNYYPQEKENMQLILETTRRENNLNLENMYFHHVSNSVWKFKIINPLSEFPNTYLASREDGTGGIIIRLVNEAVLGKKIETGDVIEAQICAFAINGGIFETEKDYEDTIPTAKNGEKYMMGDGALMPLNLIVNNNANLSEEEKAEKEHIKDNLLTYKGTIKTANAYDLNMFDMDLPQYYSVTIDTEYGELPIFFTRELLNPNMKGIGEGNIIEGELFLSGDVCINDYDKYIRDNDITVQ